jgi:hypothetical protein
MSGFEEEEKETDNYYIGMYVHVTDKEMLHSGILIEHPEKLYLGMAISNRLFFKYEYKYIYKYLCSSITYCKYARYYHRHINIMQLNIINNELYTVIVKTYWIRIIQRHWKNIIKKRKENIEKMKTYRYLQYRELGKKNKSIYKMPILEGMLSLYSNKKD